MLVRLLSYHSLASQPSLWNHGRTSVSYLPSIVKLPSKRFTRFPNFTNGSKPRSTFSSIRNKPVVFLKCTKCRKYTTKPAENLKLDGGKKALVPKGAEVKRLLSLAKPERYRLFGEYQFYFVMPFWCKCHFWCCAISLSFWPNSEHLWIVFSQGTRFTEKFTQFPLIFQW